MRAGSPIGGIAYGRLDGAAGSATPALSPGRDRAPDSNPLFGGCYG